MRSDPRIERCACGGEVVALDGRHASIELAVQQHQATILHRLWRCAVEREEVSVQLIPDMAARRST